MTRQPSIPMSNVNTDPTRQQDTQAEAARWLARRNSGDCTAGDQQDFLRWLNADEANRKAYEEAERLWKELGSLDSIAGRQLEEARAHLSQARRRPARHRILGYALAASLAGVLSWNLGWLDFIYMQTYQTAIGERQTVALADGSQLELDTNSKVKVHYTEGKRELKLVRGQAAFKVAPGDARPFDVLAEDVRVHDISTQFAMRQDAERVSVVVLEGRVEVYGSKETSPHPLQQGQRISHTAQNDFSPVETIDIATAAAWREGKLVFNARPLGEVLAELNRYHAAKLSVSNPWIMEVAVSGGFRTDDLPLALKTIAASLQLRLTQTGAQSWQFGI